MEGGVHVLVAADQRMFAEALVTALGQTGITGNAVAGMADACRVTDLGGVDLVVVDIDLTPEGGEPADPPWRHQLGVPLVVLSGNGEADGRASDAVRAGVRGWVPKHSPMPHLRNVINGVLQGETWIPPALLTKVLSDLTCTLHESEGEAKRLATLTAREREILSLLCTGTTRSAIASQLFLSPNTVRTHIQNLMGKLGVHSSLAAVAVARRAGLPDSAY